ncbi:hypothetical protein Tco_0262983, partial [Tanacetum coccineum]
NQNAGTEDIIDAGDSEKEDESTQDSMLVQPTQDEGASSERPSEAQPTPSPASATTGEVPHEPQNDSSPAQTKTSGENLGGHSSSDKSLSGKE